MTTVGLLQPINGTHLDAIEVQKHIREQAWMVLDCVCCWGDLTEKVLYVTIYSLERHYRFEGELIQLIVLAENVLQYKHKLYKNGVV